MNPAAVNSFNFYYFGNGDFAVSWTKEYWEEPFVFQYPSVVYVMDPDGNALWEQVFYSEYEQVLCSWQEKTLLVLAVM